MIRITHVTGTVLPLEGDNIDTDRIIPARFLRTVSFDGLERHVFEDDRAADRAAGRTHPFDDARFAGARVLAVNTNFGCGSSREHAPQSLYRRGIRAVVGESFSEIFFGNAVMLGMPCVTAAARDVRALQALAPAAEITIDLESRTCTAGTHLRFAVQLPDSARDAFISGAWDGTALLLSDPAAIDRTADALPYLRW